MVEIKKLNNAPGQGADIKKWLDVFDFLAMSHGPVRAREIMQGCHLSKDTVDRVLDSLSIHSIPVYEELRGAVTYYGVLHDLDRSTFFDLINSDDLGRIEPDE
jgi:hypothetical protein